MFKEKQTTLNQVLCRLRAINLWHLLIIIILAEIVTAVMNTIMGILWWGSISYDLIIIGIIDAFVAAALVGTIILYLIDRSHEASDKYRELVENANTIILRMDTGGRVTFFNEFAEMFFGFSKEEIIGMSVVGTIVPERESTGRDLDYMIRDLCLHTDDYSVNINENMKKDGSLVWISWTNKPVFDTKGRPREILCIGSDFTELRQKDEQLQIYSRELERLVSEKTFELSQTIRRLEREIAERRAMETTLLQSEERFREFFEQDEDALIIASPDDYAIIDANPSTLFLYGYLREELLTEGLSLFLKEPDQARIFDSLQKLLPSRMLQINNVRTRAKNGATITVSFRCLIVQLKQSRVLFCSFRNITDKIRLQEETKWLQAKLIQMNKMSSLGILVSSMAHEINNPNHVIALNAQLVSDVWRYAAKILTDHYHAHGDFLLGSTPFSQARHDIPLLLTAISGSAERISNIISNLKDFSRQSEASLNSPVDINKAIESSVALLKSRIDKYTDCFEVKAAVGSPLVKGNRQQLEQVVMNLILNALQSLRSRREAVIVSSCVDEETDTILVRVADEGIGIPETILERITEPFFSTKLEEGGTGLGLSISCSILKDHEASLTFTSEPGAGTIATVSLPRYQSPAERTVHDRQHIA